MNKIRDDPNFRGAFGRSFFKTLYDQQISPDNTRNRICKEPFMTVPIIIYTKKDFYLLDKINEKIEFLKASGLIDFWHYQEVKKGAMFEAEFKGPRTLKIEHLLGCFQILLYGCFISLIILALEFLLSVIFESTKYGLKFKYSI